MFNFKKTDSQTKFQKATSIGNYVSSVFGKEECVDTATENFLKQLQKILFKCFHKMRMRRKKPNKKMKGLFALRRKLKKKKANHDTERLQDFKEQNPLPMKEAGE